MLITCESLSTFLLIQLHFPLFTKLFIQQLSFITYTTKAFSNYVTRLVSYHFKHIYLAFKQVQTAAAPTIFDKIFLRGRNATAGEQQSVASAVAQLFKKLFCS